MKQWTFLIATSMLLSSTSLTVAESNNEPPEAAQLVKFLIAESVLTPGVNAQLIPLSFYVGNVDDVANYFGDFICVTDNTCTVVDTFDPHSFSISARNLPLMQDSSELVNLQAEAQNERTQIKFGTDIYHAATWQIALALAARHELLDQQVAQELITNELDSILNVENRSTGSALDNNESNSVTDPIFAFTFRWLATHFFNKDPFFNSRFQEFIIRDFQLTDVAKVDPFHHTPAFFEFVTSWSDARALTGQNIWAHLIGPLQAECLLFNGKIHAKSLALYNAINSLSAFSRMQTGIGAFYHSSFITQDMRGREISIEDNLVMLAGLQLLKNILQNTTEQSAEIRGALSQINTMLYGGMTVNGFNTLGLLSFLYNGAFDVQKGIFFTHGSIQDPSAFNGWRPHIVPFSVVKTNLWGISILGVATIDKWFGQGRALQIWQIIRNQGGYYNNGVLWGLGYSLNNSIENIMTTEGSAAAINALNSLIAVYTQTGFENVGLNADLETLKQNIIHLRNDNYLDSNFSDATPREYFIPIPEHLGRAYLYASKRFVIPLEWNANTLGSVNANAWVLFILLKFNPFQFNGEFIGEIFPIPEKLNIFAQH